MESCQLVADGALEARDGRGSGHLERMESPRAHERKLLVLSQTSEFSRITTSLLGHDFGKVISPFFE